MRGFVTRWQRGQSLAEFSVAAVLLLILIFGLIDFGRAFNTLQMMVALSRQGSNLASRGDTLTQAVAGVISGEAPLNIGASGEVIITSVTNESNVYTITGQVTQGALSNSSRIGSGVGSTATVPAGASTLLQPGQTIYITEIFYQYQPITPVGTLLNTTMPSTLYEAAYF
jgi:Flp pilus assembly protein TadG